MTGFDGLIDARAQQISDVVRRSRSRLLPGTGKETREQSFGEGALAVLGIPEELITKAAAKLYSNDPKYSFSRGIGNYNTQVGFADIFRDSGMDPAAAAVLGVAAAIANPLDPLNKLKILAPTKLGRAAETVASAGKNLVKGTDDLWRISTKNILEEIAAKRKALTEGAYAPDVARLAARSVDELEKSVAHADELNNLLVELQKRGVTLGEMQLANSLFDQVRLGQRHLVGFSSPSSLEHLSILGFGNSPASDYSAVGLGGKYAAAAVKTATSIKQKLVKPLGDAAYKLADYIGIPTIRTEKAKQAATSIKNILDTSKANVAEVERDLLSVYKQFLDEAGPEGFEAAKNDLLSVVQALEFRHSGAKQMALDELSKLAPDTKLTTGKGVVAEKGGGLSDEQKLRLTQSGVADAEIPTAIGQFENANVPSIRNGKDKQNEVRLLGQYVVVKSSDARLIDASLDELDGIYGNRVWAKHKKDDGIYLVQKRHPGAKRITNLDDFQPEHLKNLEAIAAQLSVGKKGFTAMSPNDILVSPSGAVQLINPSVIAEYKSAKDAVANSKQVLDSLAEYLGVPKGSLREFPSLRNTATARLVPRGVDGLTFRAAKGGDTYASAHELLEQAVNTDGFKQYIRAAYDQVSPQDLAKKIGDPAEFERANNIEFERKRIRDQIAAGLSPTIEPVSFVKDDLGNIHVRSINGRARLTAAILEGIDAVPIYQHPFVGDVTNLVEKGFYSGNTVKLTSLWNDAENSSAINVAAQSGNTINADYSILTRNGEVARLDAESIQVIPTVASDFNKLLTAGPQFVGKARAQRINSVETLLTQRFGNMRNALIRVAEIAEVSPDTKTFVEHVEKLLVNPQTGKGIKLDNTLRHPDASNILMHLKEAATKTLDSLASRGYLTNLTIGDTRRVLLATDYADVIVQHMDFKSNTLKVYGNQTTTAHLQKSVEAFINKTVPVEDVEPLARISLYGSDGVKNLEVRDLIKGEHPKLTDIVDTPKVFSISKEQSKQLASRGIFVADDKTVGKIRGKLEERGIKFGVLLRESERAATSTKTGRYVTGRKEPVILRPEFTFFATKSGALVVGTKHNNVQDLLTEVFEEGPAYFQEFGVITTGKVVMSNPFGSKMEKIGYGEMKLLQRRLEMMAKRFVDLGLSKGTVLSVHTPFDDAVWRSIYGERVTLGDILDKDFKLNIPDELRGMSPDMHVLSPKRVGYQPNETGIVGIEKTRLANAKLQKLFETLEGYADQTFLDQAKAGLPISYYSSWFGRQLTKQAKEALNEAWLKHADKESKTFKHIESAFKGRVLTDFTTQEVNSIIRRLQKEGVENANDIISDVVKKFREGYELNPTRESAAALIGLSKALPEGIDFFYTDPIWAQALATRNAQRAIGRQQIVDSLKANGVTLWHGTVKELNELKIGKNKDFIELDRQVKTLNDQLAAAKIELDNFLEATPDLTQTTRKAELESKVDTITNELARTISKKGAFLEKIGEGKKLDMMVDLESDHLWITGESLNQMIENGLISHADILGDPSDAFVRIPAKKYASILDENNAEAFLFPKEVAGVVQKYFGATTKDGFNKFLGLWDSVHSLWRNWTLFPIPAYHARNMVSNMFMAYLGDVTDPEVYKQSLSILHIVDGHRKGTLTKKQVQEALGAISVVSVGGQVVSGQQIFDEFVKHGGFAGGLHFNEFNAFGNLVRASEFERLSIQAGLRPSSELVGSWLFDNSALRLGVSAAAYVENRFRLATFIDAFTKGRVETMNGSVLSGYEAAAMHMKRVFYDYTDLSAFERGWLRRVIPFYSWSRHNIPRMLETLLTDPIKHYRLAEFFHEVETGVMEGQPIDENTIPDWIRDRYGIIVGKSKEGNYMMKVGDGFLPMIDAYKMLAGGSLTRMIKDGLTPFIKTPIEQLLNYSMYSDKPIERYAGERAESPVFAGLGFSRRVTTEGPLGVLNVVLNESLFKTFFRPSGEISSKLPPLIDAIFSGEESASVKLAVTALFLGKAYEVNPGQARAAVFSDWRKRHSQILGLRNQAMEKGDTKSVEDADKMLTWLRLQYPGK